MLDEGAIRLDLYAALPHRSRAKIRSKITQLRGRDSKVTKPQVTMKQHETIEQYPEAHPETAGAMNVSISKSSSRQNARNEQPHRLRRLNLAVLKSSSFARVAQLSDSEAMSKRFTRPYSIA